MLPAAELKQPAESTDKQAENLKQFLHWFDQTLLKNKKTKLEIFGNITAAFTATPANMMAYFLGRDFGVMIGNLCDANEETKQFLSAIFGIVAYIPTGILYNMAARGGLDILVALFSQHADLFKIQDKKLARTLSTFVAYLLAPFACLPFIAYTKHYVDETTGNVLSSILFFASFAAALNAITNILKKIFSMFENDSVKKIRAPLETCIDGAIQSVKTMDESRLKFFYDEVRSKIKKSLSDEEILQLVCFLLSQVDVDHSNQAAAPEEKSLSRNSQRTINIFSYVMAGIAMYPLNRGAMITSGWICDWMNIPEENKQSTKLTMTALAIMANALFCAFHANNALQIASKNIINKKWRPPASAVIAAGFATAASTMNVVIAVESGENPWFVAPAFFIPTAMRIMAFIYLVDVCKKLFNQYRFKNSPTPPAVQRETLIDLLSTLKIKLALINSDYLLSLESALSILASARLAPGTMFNFSSSNEIELQVEESKTLTLSKT